MFDVAQGKKFAVQRNDTGLTAPSVYGHCSQSLNYNEIVVHDPDAALPTKFIKR